MMNPNTKTFNSTSTIVFIDAGVDNANQLIQGVISNAQVFILGKTADGIEQISQVLGQYQNTDTVHIISHGAPGSLSLGNSQLSLDTLNHYAPQLQQWNITNLLLYGCNVAAGDAGAEFIAKLHALTGSEIAASKSLTGSATKGGNWELEVTTGQISSPLALRPEVMATYPGLMSVVAETEPNNSIASAQAIAASNFSLDYSSDIQTYDGTNISTTVPHVSITGSGDGTYDYYQFNASAGQEFIFDIDENNFDTELFLFDINGNLLTGNDDSTETGHTGDPDSSWWWLPSFITYTIPNSGSYVIGVGKYYSEGVFGEITGSVPEGGDSYTLHIVGGTASDPIVPISGTPNNDILNGTASADQIDGLAGSDRLYGKAGNDTIDGGEGDDIVYGGNDNDLLRGGNGSDRLYGDAGNDELLGGDGDDILYGGDGDDLLDGGAGSDRLYGNAGIDTFVLAPGVGQDLINGFEDGTDKIRLDGGLVFSNLLISPSGTSTLIKVLATGATLASLTNISSTLIGSDDFI